MIKFIDYFLFKVVLYFKKDKLFNDSILLIIWLIAFNVVSYGFSRYQIYYWGESVIGVYDILLILLFIVSYYRAKWIMKKTN